VWAPGTVSHLDLDWEARSFFWDRLAGFARLIRFDKRGTGLSDRLTDIASLEERIDDIRAVLDAVGSERAVIAGSSEGGSMAMLFAATYPQRTRALIVRGAQARWVWAPDMPWGISEDEYLRQVEELAQHGVTEEYIRGFGAGYGHELTAEEIEDEMRYFRAGASPAALADLERMNFQIDVRDILPSIQAPTLILNASHDPVSAIEGARYLAERIPNARLFEYESSSHIPASREEATMLLDEIEQFVTGTRPAPHSDRILTTVLFTDIVDSTRRAGEMGDARWKELLAAHDVRARAEFARFSGVEVDHAGDGFLVRFDGPARAVRCAQAVGESVRGLGILIRAGLHTGEVELTPEGIKGLAVHIGARVSAMAGADEVLVSSTVRDLTVGSGLVFEDAGDHELKGIPDPWRLFRVAG
jgi:pimeloyl-ACP methyl ester carboxylesterase